MLAGRPPFLGESVLSVLHLHVSAPVPVASTVAPELPPGVDATLRVNGTATIDDDPALREAHRVADSLPATVLVVSVREAYLQCGKALMRSKLWAEESRIERSRLPTMGEMLKDHTRSNEAPETQAAMLERYKTSLY